MKPPALQRSMLAHLLQAGAPESSRDLAARFLRIQQGDEATCQRLITPLLAGIPGVSHDAGRGWSFRPSPRIAGSPPGGSAVPEEPDAPDPRAGGTTLRDFVALASDGAGPGGSGAVRTVSLLPCIGGEECQEEHLPPWAPDAEGWDPEVDLQDTDLDPPAARAAALQSNAGLSAADLETLIETIGDLPVVCHRAGREVEPIRRACAAAGMAFHPAVISASKLGHLLLGLKANHAAVDLAAALQVETRGPDDCRGRVRLIAAAYIKMIPLFEERGIEAVDTLLEFQDMPAAPIDLSGYAFSHDDLRSLPAGPGVYRFLDRDGAVIYVGKAKNLRARVSSYFSPVARATPKGQAILAQVHALDVEPVASDLEAALAEAAQIAEHRPPLNRQFEVHERPAPYGPRLNLVVVLPDAHAPAGGPLTCTAHLLRGGVYRARLAGLVTGNASRAGWDEVLERIAAIYFPDGASGSGSAPGAGVAPAGIDIDWQLVASYVRKNRDALNLLDIDECPSLAEASKRLRVLVEAACSAGRVVAR